MKTTTTCMALAALVGLAACGGGGGGSSASIPAPTPAPSPGPSPSPNPSPSPGPSPSPNPSPSPCTASASSLASLQVFPAASPWRTDISQAPLDARSPAIISFLNETAAPLFTDFGSGLYDGAPIGIPFVVVCADQPKVAITYRANANDGNYGSESDAGPFPIPLTAPIEGNGTGDSHVIAVDAANHKLYELYNASLASGGAGWSASSGAKFDFDSTALRPLCYTSADAAGLPIFPGLVRYDEVLAGAITHPIRFTLQRSRVSPMFVSPARHYVGGTNTSLAMPTPMGMRLRLKASVDLGAYSATNRVILTAMKKYGIILADIGSNFYISGAPDARWNNDDLRNLRAIRPSDFEVVQMDTIFNSASAADRATCAP
jgi:hypothetical protein